MRDRAIRAGATTAAQRADTARRSSSRRISSTQLLPLGDTRRSDLRHVPASFARRRLLQPRNAMQRRNACPAPPPFEGRCTYMKLRDWFELVRIQLRREEG